MRVLVSAASDIERDPERMRRWGDYHLKGNLLAALMAQGHEIDGEQPEVIIHCYGVPVRLPDWSYNILYIHSHPDGLTREYCQRYDKVFCISPQFLPRLWEWGIDAELAGVASDFEPIPGAPLEHDAVFVANAKGYKGNSRAIVQALGDLNALPFKLEIWGEGWQGLPDGIWQGEYYPYERLNALYASSAVVLNDEHDDMRREGFVNPRVVDAVRAGAAVVTLPNEGYRLLHLPVTIFESPEQVAGLIEARKAGHYIPFTEGGCTYDELAARLMSNIPVQVRIDLGCGKHKRPGFIGVDAAALPGVDIVADIRREWPLEADSADYMVADNLMEHIGGEFIDVMNHAWETVRQAGKFRVVVPAVTSTAAFQDPTHVRYFAPETWDYFAADNPRWQQYGVTYGIRPWLVLDKRVDERFIDVLLRPVKGAW